MTYQNGRTNPHRLYRDRENARVAGVCAGIADYFEFNLTAIRLLTLGSMMFMWPALIYLLLAFLLPVRPAKLYDSPEQATFWRGVSNAPRDTFGDQRLRFRDMELRVGRSEAYGTSAEFEIDRELAGSPGTGKSRR